MSDLEKNPTLLKSVLFCSDLNHVKLLVYNVHSKSNISHSTKALSQLFINSLQHIFQLLQFLESINVNLNLIFSNKEIIFSNTVFRKY